MKSIFHPLELADNYHINLWSENDAFKCSIAYFIKEKEGHALKFVGARPFDKRVNWLHFKLLAELGQKALDLKFNEDRD